MLVSSVFSVKLEFVYSWNQGHLIFFLRHFESVLEDVGSCSHLCQAAWSWLRVVGCGSGARLVDRASAGFLLDPDCGRGGGETRGPAPAPRLWSAGACACVWSVLWANVARLSLCRRLTGFPPGRGLGGGRGRDSRVSSRPRVCRGSAAVLGRTWSDRSDGDAIVFMTSPSLLPL